MFKRLLLLCLALCLFIPHADIYSELVPGIVCVAAQETIPFRLEPVFSAEPLWNLGPGVCMTLLDVDYESNWAHVRLRINNDVWEGYVRPGSLMNGDYLGSDICRVVNPEKGQRLNLRSNPSPDAPSLGQYYTGVLANYYGIANSGYVWLQIGNQTGYMDKQFITPHNATAASEIPVTRISNPEGTGGNLRLEPSIGAALIDFYPNGTEVCVLGITNNGWAHVMIGGVTGFMMKNKLESFF